MDKNIEAILAGLFFGLITAFCVSVGVIFLFDLAWAGYVVVAVVGCLIIMAPIWWWIGRRK